jgi:hypothetical protein
MSKYYERSPYFFKFSKKYFNFIEESVKADRFLFCNRERKIVYGYIRVSTDKQTVENQRFEIENFCKNEKMEINVASRDTSK